MTPDINEAIALLKFKLELAKKELEEKELKLVKRHALEARFAETKDPFEILSITAELKKYE
jgi:hypothetical protein